MQATTPFRKERKGMKSRFPALASTDLNDEIQIIPDIEITRRSV
jgi:hypothetical protein